MRAEQRYRLVWKPLTFVACSTPLALLALGAFGIAGRSLGADPISAIQDVCGKTALNLLLITLAVTPVRQLAHRPQLIRLRRMLGVFAFVYALLHFLVYLALEQALDVRAVALDVLERPYITIGFLALVMLIPLAVTSTNGMMRRLGRRWQKLHRLVYAIAILGVWHYWWQVKADVREPLIYAAILALLLGYRVWRSRWFTSRFGSATAPERT